MNRICIVMLSLLMILSSCYNSKNPIRQEMEAIENGAVDTSYIYALPFEKGKTFRVIQGYFSQFSHKERAAIDFNMKPGVRIAAARAGVVLRLKEDGEKGGFNTKYRPEGNYIVIEHEDGSRAGYWHLQKDGVLVNLGDKVEKGQIIAISGKTGYAAFPHLHFLVWKSRENRRFQQIPTRFQTADGVKYLKFWKKYKN